MFNITNILKKICILSLVFDSFCMIMVINKTRSDKSRKAAAVTVSAAAYIPYCIKMLSLLDPIHHAVGLAVALEFAFGAVEEVTYFNIGTFVLGIGALEHPL